jgi:hypothetical protein
MIFKVMATKGPRKSERPWSVYRDAGNGEGFVAVLSCPDRKFANKERKVMQAIIRALDEANYNAIGPDKIVDHLRRMGVEGDRYTRACIAQIQDDGKGGKYYRYAHCKGQIDASV